MLAFSGGSSASYLLFRRHPVHTSSTTIDSSPALLAFPTSATANKVNRSPCTSECLRRYHPNRKPVPRVGVRQRSPRELLAALSGELDAETGPENAWQQPRGLRYRGHFCICHSFNFTDSCTEPKHNVLHLCVTPSIRACTQAYGTHLSQFRSSIRSADQNIGIINGCVLQVASASASLLIGPVYSRVQIFAPTLLNLFCAEN